MKRGKIMNIEECTIEEQDYLIDRLVEYNLSQVNAEQTVNFIDLSKKIVEEGKIIAGIIARMYCWNMVYVDTLWVDTSYRGKKIGEKLLKEVESEAKSKGAKLVHLICPLSSRQVKYIKLGANERPRILCGRFSMHTIFLYTS